MNCYPNKGKAARMLDTSEAAIEITHGDFTPEEKRITTLIARMALAGHAVHKLQDGFLVTRWGMSRHCPDLAALVNFGRVLGVSE
jgi:hypothetical protein